MTIRKPIKPPIRRDVRKDDGPRINEEITAKEIRVVDEKGEMRGVMSVAEALVLAENAGLDLVEVSPNAAPPVCKVLDYGKYKYEQQKKAAEARKKQKIVDIKEIKIRPGIEDHDYQVKKRNAQRFLEEGDKVKVTMRFRGREMAHQDIGMAILKRFQEDLAAFGKTELGPKFEGRQVIMVIGPASP
ncbi:MAG: translation initiation factor IF-3 [Alphaproteobacteria bacterium]